MSFKAFFLPVNLGIGLLLLTQVAVAATVPEQVLIGPFPGSATVPEPLMITPFPGARLSDSELKANTDHGVVIGSVRKVNNRMRAEKEVRRRGKLVRATFEIPAGHSQIEAFNHAMDQLLNRPNSMLFFCEGRACGASSLWANEVLDNARLNGPDDNQIYLALSLDEDPRQLVSLYAITGGNRRVYLHIDQFTPEEPILEPLYPTPSTLLKLLHTNGKLVLPGLELEAAEPSTDAPLNEGSEVWLNLVNRMLRSDTRVRISISGHQAPTVMQRLVDLGIRPARLEIDQPLPDIGVKIEKL
tara:strand:- start:4551 stop:5450 length:900 start_codon:yes stop_codon:yes gene_type:complete